MADLPKWPRKEKPILQFARKLTHLAYPPLCLSCGSETDADSILCQNCWPDAHFIAGSVCNACGVPLPGVADASDVCENCHASPPLWSQGRAVGLYTGPLRKMVMSLKHGDRHDIARHMAKWMYGAGSDLITDTTHLVPVPLHWSRMMRRRFNQSVLIAQHLTIDNGIPHLPDALQRIRATKLQKDMTRVERFENQRGAIRAHPKQAETLVGKSVLLIDDVMTTGATLSACTQACHDAGATSVNILVFARVARAE